MRQHEISVAWPAKVVETRGCVVGLDVLDAHSGSSLRRYGHISLLNLVSNSTRCSSTDLLKTPIQVFRLAPRPTSPTTQALSPDAHRPEPTGPHLPRRLAHPRLSRLHIWLQPCRPLPRPKQPHHRRRQQPHHELPVGQLRQRDPAGLSAAEHPAQKSRVMLQRVRSSQRRTPAGRCPPRRCHGLRGAPHGMRPTAHQGWPCAPGRSAPGSQG